MHDLATIQKMNATPDFKVGDLVMVKDCAPFAAGRIGTVSFVDNSEDRETELSVRVDFSDSGYWFFPGELTTVIPDLVTVAQGILDNHGIQDHFLRTGNQIRDLLVEALVMGTRILKD